MYRTLIDSKYFTLYEVPQAEPKIYYLSVVYTCTICMMYLEVWVFIPFLWILAVFMFYGVNHFINRLTPEKELQICIY